MVNIDQTEIFFLCRRLNDNILYLEDLSKVLEESLNDLKNLFEKINQNKEDLKIKIRIIFTKMRDAINEREDDLLLEVDEFFDITFFSEKLVKTSDKLPIEVKRTLEKSKSVKEEWNNYKKLQFLINDCIIIENNTKKIKLINQEIKQANSITNLEVKFTSEKKINKFIDGIFEFGDIYKIEKYQFRKCPENIDENKKYNISGKMNNIVKKIGSTGYWIGVPCENQLELLKEYKWKIKIKRDENQGNDNYNYYNNYNFYNYKYNSIRVGVAPIDFKINESSYNYGWYLDCSNSYLYSGPPHNYNGKDSNLDNVGNEVVIALNIKNQTLKFIINNEDKGESYKNIPIDKPLTPVVFLYYKNDSVEIIQVYD